MIRNDSIGRSSVEELQKHILNLTELKKCLPYLQPKSWMSQWFVQLYLSLYFPESWSQGRHQSEHNRYYLGRQRSWFYGSLPHPGIKTNKTEIHLKCNCSKTWKISKISTLHKNARIDIIYLSFIMLVILHVVHTLWLE